MKFASCPEQEVLAPVRLPALPRRNDSLLSPLASRHWSHDLPATSAWPHDLISVTNGDVPVGRGLMGYAVVAARHNRMHKLATIGSRIILCTRSTNVREVLGM